jgi:hypothetical protein
MRCVADNHLDLAGTTIKRLNNDTRTIKEIL